jgi:hypothetical protein
MKLYKILEKKGIMNKRGMNKNSWPFKIFTCPIF